MGLTIPSLPQELFGGTRVRLADVKKSLDQLHRFAKSFAPFFYRREQADLSEVYLEGLASDLHRKSAEPIAIAHLQSRQGLQRFVGQGKWTDADVRGELHRQVSEELGDPDGILILDGSGFAKKGDHSVGVARQWCNHLGKTDNCQVGVFIAFYGRGSSTLVDGDLYLPHAWTRSRARLDTCHVPSDVGFRNKIEIAEELHQRIAPRIAHGWTTGDDEFGRPSWFRNRLHHRKERYVLEVPSNTVVRDLEAPLPSRQGASGRKPKVPFMAVEAWAKSKPTSAWSRVVIRQGEKGPAELEVITTSVRAHSGRKVGRKELLIVTRTLTSNPEYKFFLSNADALTSRDVLARVSVHQHRIEEAFQIAKDDLGMDHYEVRSWVGWHHHMTMSFLAQWFLTLEHRRLGKKIARPDGLVSGEDREEPAA